MGTLFKILKQLKKGYKFLAIGLLGTFFTVGAQLSTPMITRKIMQLIETGSSLINKYSLKLALVLLILYFLQAAGQFLKTYFNHLAAWDFVDEFRVSIYKHVQKLSMSYFHNKQTGQLMSRITADTRNLEMLIAHALPDIVGNIFILSGSIILLFSINATLAFYTLLAVPVTVVCVIYYSKKVRPLFKKSHSKLGELNAIVQDNLSGIKEIQSFNREEFALDKVNSSSKEHKCYIMKALKKGAIFHPLIMFSSNIGNVIIIAAGGILAAKGEISASDLIAFLMFISYFFQPMSSMGQILEHVQTALTAADRAFEILETEPDIKDRENAVTLTDVKGMVEYKNVDFSYSDNKPILKNISIKVKPGQTVALVGPTGIGKTTFINLLERFYDTDKGEILIDGLNIKNATLKSLRDNISLVLQDVFLFHGTIAENIAFGSDNVSQEDIINAAKIANAHEFIEKTEDGYNTIVGERGMRLSGGQKQRISIARAVLKNSPILILDEATSSVDTKTEKLIQESIDILSKSRTTFIIAHRLSTIRNADIIVVLGNEGIEECGTHDELAAINGKYAELLKMID